MRCSKAFPLPRNPPIIQRRPISLTCSGLRDRALIAMMVFSFARIGAVIQVKVSDYFVQGRRRWVRLHFVGRVWVRSSSPSRRFTRPRRGAISAIPTVTSSR
jgi:integrase